MECWNNVFLFSCVGEEKLRWQFGNDERETNKQTKLRFLYEMHCSRMNESWKSKNWEKTKKTVWLFYLSSVKCQVSKHLSLDSERTWSWNNSCLLSFSFTWFCFCLFVTFVDLTTLLDFTISDQSFFIFFLVFFLSQDAFFFMNI